MRDRCDGSGAVWWRWALTASLAVLVTVVVVEGYALSHRLHRVDLTLAPTDHSATTYLLVGTDDRRDLGAFRRPEAFGAPSRTPGRRADVIMLVRVPRRGRPASVAIPRDLVVIGERHGPVRLTLLRLGGLQPLVTALCRSLGVAPDHVVETSFDGLRGMVDAVGGVLIDEPAPARDAFTQLNVPAGRRRIDGETAVAYVRSRHMEHLIDGRWVADREGAAGRERRQRHVLGQLGRAARSVLTRPVAAQRLAWTTMGSLTVSRSTGLVDLARLGLALARAENVTLPVERHDGVVPWARLEPEGRRLLERFAPPAGVTRRSSCPEFARVRR